MSDFVHDMVGRGADTILWWQMAIRAIVIFLYLLALVRLGGKRIFGKNTSFDIVLGIMLGSILSRALTANARLFPTLAASAVLVALHVVLANVALRSSVIGQMVKGKEQQLVQDGHILTESMRRCNVTEHDLREALRSNANTSNLSDIKAAYLERSGDISFVRK